MSVKPKEEWSKSYIVRPSHNIQSHVMINADKFIPSYDKNRVRTAMNWLLAWEYGRQWLVDRCKYIKKRDQGPRITIKNDYQTWIQKRDPKAKKTVKVTPK